MERRRDDTEGITDASSGSKRGQTGPPANVGSSDPSSYKKLGVAAKANDNVEVQAAEAANVEAKAVNVQATKVTEAVSSGFAARSVNLGAQ